MAWYLADHLGSVRDLTDTQGGVIDHVQYDSFGSVLSETNPSAGDRFKFTGREYDEATGQYYYRARYYDPATGRFTSEDPIGFQAGDANVYRYVRNSPTRFTDPTGLQEADDEEEETEVAAYDGDDSGGRKWKTADGDDFKEAADDYDHAIDFPSWGDFIET